MNMPTTGLGAPRILVGYDDSPGAATAIRFAGALLAPREAFVCHIWIGLSHTMLCADPDMLPGALRERAEELDEFDRGAAERIAEEGARLARAAGFDAEPLAVREERKVWRTLLATAEHHQASVIVVGAHGLSGLGKALLGSVSTAVVHHATQPVLVVPAAAENEPADGPLLLCYDGSGPASRAIEKAGELCEPRSALVLHFWQSWVAEAPALAGASRAVQRMAAELDEIATEQSDDRTAAGVELARQAGFEAGGLSQRAEGPAWEAVLTAAVEHDCSAIVVGSRGLTGLSAALGSVSNGVIHHSRRPVLVVPPEAAQ
jgi:nucleotide-binding universal stress UspA family protein